MKQVTTYIKESVNIYTGEYKKVRVIVNHGFDALGDYYGSYKEEIIEKNNVKEKE